MLIVGDMENTDWTLGEVLGHRPRRSDRPDWERLPDWVARYQDLERASFRFIPVHQVHELSNLDGYVHKMRSFGYRPFLVKREHDREVVDEAIIRLLHEMRDRPGDIVLLSHDGVYYDALKELRIDPRGNERAITVVGFTDRMSRRYLEADWITTIDLEELGLFDDPLPNRYLPVAVDDFDAAALLNESGLFPPVDPPAQPDAA